MLQARYAVTMPCHTLWLRHAMLDIGSWNWLNSAGCATCHVACILSLPMCTCSRVSLASWRGELVITDSDTNPLVLLLLLLPVVDAELPAAVAGVSAAAGIHSMHTSLRQTMEKQQVCRAATFWQVVRSQSSTGIGTRLHYAAWSKRRLNAWYA